VDTSVYSRSQEFRNRFQILDTLAHGFDRGGNRYGEQESSDAQIHPQNIGLTNTAFISPIRLTSSGVSTLPSIAATSAVSEASETVHSRSRRPVLPPRG
jgi:hypothetical protein